MATAALLAGVTACDRRPREPAANDTAAAETPAVEGDESPRSAPVSMNGWRVAEAGQVLAVPTPASALRAQLVFPQYTDSTLTTATRFDVAPLQGVTVELFGPSGLIGTATLVDAGPAPPRTPAAATPADACTGWPQARVAPAVEPLSPWRVAFARGHARSIPLDSTPALAGPDSALVAAEVARLASALPQDAASPFRGLPFVVRDVRRFTPAEGVEALVADVVRRVNQEATQQTEHLLLVAERSTARPNAPWVTAYHERTAGPEETLEMSEVLAAVALGPAGRPTLVVGRDFGDGVAYALVERTGPRQWRLRWSSAYAGC